MKFHSVAYVMNKSNNLHKVRGCSNKVPYVI